MKSNVMPHINIDPSRIADLRRAASMLNELPAEVGEGFLAPLMRDCGWPFESVENSLHGTEWHRIFYPLSLRDFSQLKWVRKSFLLDETLLHPISKNDIELVVRTQTEDVLALVGRDSEPSRKSFAYHHSRVLSTHDFCAPVTLALTPVGLKVLDGNHRVAALLASGVSAIVELDAWVGFNAAQA